MRRYRLFPPAEAAALLLAFSFGLTACGRAETPSESSAPTGAEASVSSAPATTATTAPTAYYDEAAGIFYENRELSGKTAEEFELPLEGATGFASIAMNVYPSADTTGSPVASLRPGDAFTVLEEKDGTWWRVERENEYSGWVENTCCYLNIPDVIPSIIFDNTNAYSSVFVSSGKEIPDITGEQLYESLRYNGRFGDDRYVVAANYIMVKKIYAAQQAAMAEGYTLVINETFRPYDVQLKVAADLKLLYLDDPEVRAGIDQSPWGIGWFIANKLSTHQIGCAMDVSLARVRRIAYRLCGEYKYAAVTEYEECAMPTPIHELSAAAVSMKKPVNSYSATAWKNVESAASMTEDALRLKGYCTGAGMSPLASEWWHFNDLEAKGAIGNRYTSDVFYINTCCSRVPR